MQVCGDNGIRPLSFGVHTRRRRRELQILELYRVRLGGETFESITKRIKATKEQLKCSVCSPFHDRLVASKRGEEREDTTPGLELGLA